MYHESLPIEGANLLVHEPARDERGWFSRLRCEEELRAAGLVSRFAQSSVSFNERLYTVRGLHFQAPPHQETKIVTCLQGEIFDVIVDLRASSPTFGKSTQLRLRGGSGRSLYIPEGCAHGFQTLSEKALVHYEISAPYAPGAARGIHWLDPELAIPWPCRGSDLVVISDKDERLPSFRETIALLPR